MLKRVSANGHLYDIRRLLLAEYSEYVVPVAPSSQRTVVKVLAPHGCGMLAYKRDEKHHVTRLDLQLS